MNICTCTPDIEVINDSLAADKNLCGFCDKPKTKPQKMLTDVTYKDVEAKLGIELPTQHTPTPLRLIQNGAFADVIEGHRLIAGRVDPILAVRIVRAVNSHDELLRAAKAMHDEFLSHSRGSVAHEDCWWCAAIARAEGK